MVTDFGRLVANIPRCICDGTCSINFSCEKEVVFIENEVNIWAK